MPFKSEKQRRFMWAKHPKIAHKWAHEGMGGGIDLKAATSFIQKLYNYATSPKPDYGKQYAQMMKNKAAGDKRVADYKKELDTKDQALLKKLNAAPTPPPDKSALPYYERINAAASANEVPQDILYRVLRKESMGFNPDVISGKLNSPVGAQGIAQFMPDTAKGIGIDPLNVDQAIPAAARYLRSKYKQHGSYANALAAYNAGSGNVYKYGGVPPFKETQDYVKRILEGLPYQ